jgi:ferredoxin-NADP reductase
MLTTLKEASHQPPVWLFYAAKSAEELAFHQEFRDLATLPWFHYHPTLTEAAEVWPGRRGRWQAAEIARTVGDVAMEADIYFCGPDGMIRDLAGQFQQLGVQQTHLFYELW